VLVLVEFLPDSRLLGLLPIVRAQFASMLARSGLSSASAPPHFAPPMVIRRRRLRRERAADPLHCPDVTLKALVRGGELKVDDLGDLTYSVDRVLVLGPSQSFCAGRELAGHVSALQFATATAR